MRQKIASKILHQWLVIPACCLLLLSGCGFADKAAINEVLDQRDQAMNARDIHQLAALLSDDFSADGRSRKQKLLEIQAFFEEFSQIEMHSHDRTITLDGSLAECEQNYSLRIFRDGQWRSTVQRERIQLKHTASGWKISGGI